MADLQARRPPPTETAAVAVGGLGSGAVAVGGLGSGVAAVAGQPARVLFFCATCGSRLAAEGHCRGQPVLCPHCLRETTVPEQPLSPADPPPGESVFEQARILSLWMRFLCPACSSKLGTDARAGGALAECPHCGAGVRVPLLPGLVSPGPDAGPVPEALPVAACARAKPAPAAAAAVLSADEVRFLTADSHG